MTNIKILLDTNVIVSREGRYVRHEDIGRLFYWLDQLGYKKCIHPITRSELSNHADPKVVQAMQVKSDNYYTIQSPAQISPEVQKISAEHDKNQNDINDSTLLNEVYSNRVDCLITDDLKIHKKAALLNIDDKIYTVEKLLEKIITENPSLVDYRVKSVQKKLFGEINLQDTFFDSFRADYEEFDEWFNSKSEETAYVYEDDGNLEAFLYIKLESQSESYHNITPVFLPKKRLKIGTLKVQVTGLKIGERFIKIIFDNALQYKVDEIYVTIFEKTHAHGSLIFLLEQYGFKFWGIKKTTNGDERVYVRKFINTQPSLDEPKSSYPFVKKNADVYFTCINQVYHTEFFPDSILKTESPLGFIEQQPHRNAISKPYISHAPTRTMKPGDIIVFYRNGGFRDGVVTTIGIVDSVIDNIKDPVEFIRACRKRSVFDQAGLVKMWNKNPKYRPFVLNFLYAYSLPRRINLAKLIDLGIIQSVTNMPRGFQKIPWDHFMKIIKESKSDESIIVD